MPVCRAPLTTQHSEIAVRLQRRCPLPQLAEPPVRTRGEEKERKRRRGEGGGGEGRGRGGGGGEEGGGGGGGGGGEEQKGEGRGGGGGRRRGGGRGGEEGRRGGERDLSCKSQCFLEAEGFDFDTLPMLEMLRRGMARTDDQLQSLCGGTSDVSDLLYDRCRLLRTIWAYPQVRQVIENPDMRAGTPLKMAGKLGDRGRWCRQTIQPRCFFTDSALSSSGLVQDHP